MRRYSAITAWILLFGSVGFAEDGIVIGISGKWTARGKEVRFGSILDRNATLRCEAGSSLVVGIFESDPPLRIVSRCEKKKTLRLKKAATEPEPDPVFQRIAAAAEPYANRRTDSLTAYIGREIREAVVPILGGAVDLGPAFRKALPGLYLARFAPVAVTSAASPVELAWTPGKRLPFSSGGLRPGLYRLTLADESGPGAEAWLLASEPEDYAEAASEFQAAMNEAASWGDGLDDRLARPALRAFLEMLAERTSAPEARAGRDAAARTEMPLATSNR